MATSGILCVCSYLQAVFAPVPVLGLLGCALCGLSVGIMWPGTFSLAAAACPKGGTAMFALFALAGDLGCTTGPSLVGFVSGKFNGALQTGLAAAIVFPFLFLLGLALLKRNKDHTAEL